MFFIITNRLQEEIDAKKTSIKDLARARVMSYPFRVDELTLDQFLQEQTKTGLRQTCVSLVTEKLNINFDPAQNSFIATFIDNDSEKLAKIITFGNSELFGSNILVSALDQQY